MCSIGDCFIVLPSVSTANTVIFGRNAQDGAKVGVAQEVHYYDANEAVKGMKMPNSDAVLAILESTGDNLRIILQKPEPGVWGGDYGANERNVCVGLTWSANVPTHSSDQLKGIDIVRYILASNSSASEAVERIGACIEAHVTGDEAKYSFVVCDPVSAWVLSCCGKFWAARSFTKGYHRLPSDGLAVTTCFEKSCGGLKDTLKLLGLWNGEGDLDFAAAFDASPSAAKPIWCGDEPVDDKSYTLTNMFSTLRTAAQEQCSRSSSVSVLTAESISCHWFTATPNASESVFKPFVFAPNPKISPLTKVTIDQTTTLLHKLHAQRKPAAIEDLKALEISCVHEVNKYISEHPTADAELDELMKDCVEAEVKFYR